MMSTNIVSQIEINHNELIKRCNLHDSKIQKLSNRIDENDKICKNSNPEILKKRCDTHESRLQKLTKRIEKNENNKNNIEINEKIEINHNELKKRCNFQDSKIQKLSNRIDENDKICQNSNQQILNKRCDTHESRLQKLTERIEKNENNKKQFDSNEKKIINRITNIEQRIKKLATGFDNIKKKGNQCNENNLSKESVSKNINKIDTMVLAQVEKVLKEIEDVTLKNAKEQNVVINNTNQQMASLEKDIEMIKIQILSILDGSEEKDSSKGEQSLKYMFLLVKENLYSLKTEINGSVCARLESIEKTQQREIAALKLELRKERSCNEQLENRLQKLESVIESVHQHRECASNINAENVNTPTTSKKKIKNEKEDLFFFDKKPDLFKIPKAYNDDGKLNNLAQQTDVSKLDDNDSYDLFKIPKACNDDGKLNSLAQQTDVSKLDNNDSYDLFKIPKACNDDGKLNSLAQQTDVVSKLDDNDSYDLFKIPKTCNDDGKLNNLAQQTDVSKLDDNDSYENPSEIEESCFMEKARQYLMSLQINQNANNNQQQGETSSKENLKSLDTTFINACEIMKGPTMSDAPVEWVLRKQKETSVVVLQYSGTYYTGNPGYRIQFRAQIDRLHGDVYFSVRILKGMFDDYLKWPFTERFQISLSAKTNKETTAISWKIPAENYKQKTRKPVGKKDVVYTEWLGPFDISKYIEKKKIVFEINIRD